WLRHTLPKLVNEPAFPDARFADNFNHSTVPAAGLVDIALEPGEVGLSTDVRRQPGSFRGLQPRLQTGLYGDPKWRAGRSIRLNDHRRARCCVYERRQDPLALR